jgi:hypothetical protein
MKRALLLICSLMILMPLASGQDYYKVVKHSRISTGRNEAAAVPFEDGLVYITESNSVGASSPTDSEGRKLYTIFYWNKSGKIEQFRPELVSKKHEGPVSFSGDLNTMVFSQQRPSPGNNVDPLGLFFAERNENGEWVNERAFDFNDKDAWLFSPSLSYDGRTLYFAANYQGGLGGYDIYRSEFRGGAWTKPENLGPQVNSEGNELYPFIHPLGRLYFSTNGRDNNTGGYDLFFTAEVGGKWYNPVKLEAPMNTLSDEYHVWFSEDFKEGYLTSNRSSRSKEIFELRTDLPEFGTSEAVKRTYYKYRLVDKKLDTVNTELFRYSWLINDTLEIPGHQPIYQFPDTGVYHCTLQVFDIQLDTFLVPETFKDLNIKLHEQAVISCPDTITVGNEVVFDGTKTYLPGFNDFKYIWEFGDGSFGEGRQTTHIYHYPGRYRVTLGVQERPKNRRDIPAIRSNYKNVLVVDSGQ